MEEEMDQEKVKVHCPVCNHIIVEVVATGEYCMRLRCQKCKAIASVQGEKGRININYSNKEKIVEK